MYAGQDLCEGASAFVMTHPSCLNDSDNLCSNFSHTIKRHFMSLINLRQFIKMGLLINLCYFYLCILAFYALSCMD